MRMRTARTHDAHIALCGARGGSWMGAAGLFCNIQFHFLIAEVYAFFVIFALVMLAVMLVIKVVRLYCTGDVPTIILVRAATRQPLRAAHFMCFVLSRAHEQVATAHSVPVSKILRRVTRRRQCPLCAVALGSVCVCRVTPTLSTAQCDPHTGHFSFACSFAELSNLGA